MATHFLENSITVHCDGPGGMDYTLCGAALEGENGDEQMTETPFKVNCERCISIIDFCMDIKAREITRLVVGRRRRS